jgi:hypothetical protein
MSSVSHFQSPTSPTQKLNQERVSLRRIFLKFHREVAEQKMNHSLLAKTYDQTQTLEN